MSSVVRLTLCLLFVVPCLSTQSSAQDAKWVSLFDGKTMNGWEKVGNKGSFWEVKDGALSGSGSASMLVNTSGPYTNFRYRAEIKINDGGNSGLYFRTTRKPGFSDGYEAQIDSTHTDPIRTGSLYGHCHVYKQHVKPDTWFTYELEVRDDVWRGRKMTRIKVTVDGNELYEYMDFALTHAEGHFAFQQHDPGSKVDIRKVEVMPLPDSTARGFAALFNGQNLKGWSQKNGTAKYRVEGNTIVGKTNEGSPNSFLCTDKLYGDFELRFEVKVDRELNSGVQIRSKTTDGTPAGRVNGPQVEISLDKMAGYIYGEAAGGWMTPDNDRKPHDTFKDGEWNAYRVVAKGNNIKTWINGKRIANTTHKERYKSHPKGFIGLQVHGIGAGQGPYEVRWRKLQIKELSAK